MFSTQTMLPACSQILVQSAMRSICSCRHSLAVSPVQVPPPLARQEPPRRSKRPKSLPGTPSHQRLTPLKVPNRALLPSKPHHKGVLASRTPKQGVQSPITPSPAEVKAIIEAAQQQGFTQAGECL